MAAAFHELVSAALPDLPVDGGLTLMCEVAWQIFGARGRCQTV
jgi:hypothetical protein